MTTYEIGDHVVDHPPLFACRKHKCFLKLNRSFVDELVAWAPDIAPANLTDLAASCLNGDDEAFRLSDYLIPPKVTLFNPRKIQGHGALPYLLVFVDKRFFGIPSSYLRRRIFDGCEQCVAENDPASDASMPDYQRAAPASATPRPPAPQTRPLTKPITKPLAAGAQPNPNKSGATPRPAQQRPATGSGVQPAPQQAQGQAPNIPAAKPTRSVPKMPGAPSYKGTAPDGYAPPPPPPG